MSVGSRRSKGIVTIFDDFRFISKNYGNIEHHFRSLDTWLDGIRETCCETHFGRSLLKLRRRNKANQ